MACASALFLFSLLVVTPYLCAGIAPPQDPTTVYTKLYLNQLDKIDGVEQTFNADFYMTLYWEDNRLGDSYDPEVDWNPAVEFTNILGTVL